MTGNFIYNNYRYFKFKILYFDINWTLSWSVISYSLVLDVEYGVYVEIHGFWQPQEVWSSDTYEQSLI
jgi:hypothetical protein